MSVRCCLNIHLPPKWRNFQFQQRSHHRLRLIRCLVALPLLAAKLLLHREQTQHYLRCPIVIKHPLITGRKRARIGENGQRRRSVKGNFTVSEIWKCRPNKCVTQQLNPLCRHQCKTCRYTCEWKVIIACTSISKKCSEFTWEGC